MTDYILRGGTVIDGTGGARFTGEADAMKPVIGEIGGRGLLYLDDGSSTRSTGQCS